LKGVERNEPAINWCPPFPNQKDDQQKHTLREKWGVGVGGVTKGKQEEQKNKVVFVIGRNKHGRGLRQKGKGGGGSKTKTGFEKSLPTKKKGKCKKNGNHGVLASRWGGLSKSGPKRPQKSGGTIFLKTGEIFQKNTGKKKKTRNRAHQGGGWRAVKKKGGGSLQKTGPTTQKNRKKQKKSPSPVGGCSIRKEFSNREGSPWGGVDSCEKGRFTAIQKTKANRLTREGKRPPGKSLEISKKKKKRGR